MGLGKTLTLLSLIQTSLAAKKEEEAKKAKGKEVAEEEENEKEAEEEEEEEEAPRKGAKKSTARAKSKTKTTAKAKAKATAKASTSRATKTAKGKEPARESSSSSSSSTAKNANEKGASEIPFDESYPAFVTKATLVLCPNQLANQWQAEAERFFPELRVVVLRTQSDHAKLSYNDVMNSIDVLVVTYSFIQGPYYKALLPLEKILAEATTSRLRSRAKEAEKSKKEHADPMSVKLATILFRQCPHLHGFLWSRLVLDECHDLCVHDAHEDWVQANEIPREITWCVTGTPFPEGVDTLRNLLNLFHFESEGITMKRGQADFLRGVTFKDLSVKLFVRHTKQSVEKLKDETLNIPMYNNRNYLLEASETEKAIYRQQRDRIPRNDGSKGYYDLPAVVQLRQLCCHPQVVTEWNEIFGQDAVPMDTLREKMVEIKISLLAELRNKKVRKEGRIRKFEQSVNTGNLKLAKAKAVEHLFEAREEERKKFAKRMGITRKEELDHHLPHHPDHMSDAQKTYLQNRVRKHQTKLERNRRRLEEVSKTIQQVARDVTYLSEVLQKLEEGKERECTICYDELNEPCMTACGHYFCWKCLSDWLKNSSACPACRRPARGSEVVKFDLPATEKPMSKAEGKMKAEEIDEDLERGIYTPRDYPLKAHAADSGTKCGHMLAYIHHTIEAQPDAKFIVFSQYHNMLRLVGGVLQAGGVKSVYCEGSVHLKNRSIKAFGSDPEVKAILLSLVRPSLLRPRLPSAHSFRRVTRPLELTSLKRVTSSSWSPWLVEWRTPRRWKGRRLAEPIDSARSERSQWFGSSSKRPSSRKSSR